VTREEALGKAAAMLGKAEGSMNDEYLTKHLNLAQLYMALAKELGDAGIAQ
jgi:hypothetical protein